MQSSEKVVARKEETRLGLRWGSRKSDKLVRAYEKPEVQAYRVEVELHSRFLRREHINDLEDFDDLPDVIFPQHIHFVDIDWQRLQHQLKKLGSRGKHVLAGARKRANSLSRVRRYLRKKGIANFHRFLVPHPINGAVNRALSEWARQFSERDLNATTEDKSHRTQAAKADGPKAA